jgi:hypothetical protein
VLDYSLLSILFGFVVGGGVGRVCPGAALDYVLGDGVCVGESQVVYNAHLFVLQVYSSSFGASQWGKMAQLLSVQCI